MNTVTSLWRKQQSSKYPREERNPRLSRWSSPAVPNSGWCSSNLLLGAGMVVIQPSTHKIVVVQDTKQKYWFFPRGRKDLGETLEMAALREAYEESGYRVEFMPVHNPSRAPAPPGQGRVYEELNTEPIYMTMLAYRESRRHLSHGPDANFGYEYLTSWYMGQIANDAEPEKGTGTADEVNYISYLLTYEDAMTKVWGVEKTVLQYAWAVYLHTLEIEEARAQERWNREQQEVERSDSSGVFRMDHSDNLGDYDISTASAE